MPGTQGLRPTARTSYGSGVAEVPRWKPETHLGFFCCPGARRLGLLLPSLVPDQRLVLTAGTGDCLCCIMGMGSVPRT